MSLIMQYIGSSKWAITESGLRQIVNVVNDNYNKLDVANAFHSNISNVFNEDGSINNDFRSKELDSLIKEKNKGLDSFNTDILHGTKKVKFYNGVAIIPVTGAIFPRSNLLTLSGATDLETLSKDFKTSLQSDKVKSIIFDFDTPGGVIDGVYEFANLIYESRGDKPILSYVNGMCASAGYWIASSTDEIISSPTGEIGSIGVMCTLTDDSVKKEKSGIKEVNIVSSNAPLKNPEFGSKDKKVQIQTILDDLESVFIGSVAKHRDIEFKTVIDKFGKGDVYVGEKAVEKGMIDKIDSLESIIDKEVIKISESEGDKTFNFSTNNDGGNKMDMNIEKFKSDYPEVYNSVYEQGYKEGAKNENERIKSIENLNVKGFDNVINENKFNSEMTKDKVASIILEEQAKTFTENKKNNESDKEEVNEVSKKVETGDGDDPSENDVKSVVSSMSKGMK